MDLSDEIKKLEDQQKNSSLSFEEKIMLKDKILELQYASGQKQKPKLSYFQCTNCSA